MQLKLPSDLIQANGENADPKDIYINTLENGKLTKSPGDKDRCSKMDDSIDDDLPPEIERFQ